MISPSSKRAVTGIKHIDVTGAVRRVRDSHQAVIDNIATHAEKHRLEMNAKRDAMKQSALLSQRLPNGQT